MPYKISVVSLMLLFAVLFGACDGAKPKNRAENVGTRTSSSGPVGDVQPKQGSTKSKYLEVRKNFKTKLIRKGPSPQEMDGDAPQRFIHEISYPSEGRSLRGWVYIPNDDRTTPRPALIFCHGGFAADANDMMCVEPFLNGDYVVMGPAWRGESGNPGDFELMLGEVDDAANAARWLAKQSYIDPEHIYMFGHSVGGGISSLVALLDDVPIRHSGSSGGLYFPQIFEAWSPDITPFQFKNQLECKMRLLGDNTESMLRKHYAYIGKEDDPFPKIVDLFQSGKIVAPLLHTELVPGNHFTSFDGSVKKYFAVVEADRRE